MSTPSDHASKVTIVTAADLPLHCPTPSMKLWNSHPRVFIDVTTTGQAKCPYCGTVYQFDGPAPVGH
ncbi:MAG: zinc-finger domain-containing protein [Aeromicrobium sp.]|nr:zinc-finger domain-containing protein [Burkholderiales bacterium]